MTKNLPFQEQIFTDANGYQYSQVVGDENGVRTYCLKNGLMVFLAQNFDAPKIQTYIPVKTGSNNDPADNTGLAHYLEHMMFKGTSKIATADWEKEEPLLNQLSDLFEKHKKETDPELKKAIYKEIDAVSYEASTYAIANEYDKIISTIGATHTNAHTWLDETVYKNNIPSNELERWLMIEKERFSEITLRLFHTELEAVYEEFNSAQDNDSRLTNYALMEGLFPNHPNGQQTTLGKAEHLKNPSMKAIHQYFSDYYVPNNYAMVLVGDLDFETTIQLIDRYFGTFEYKALPEKKLFVEKPLTQKVTKTVKSPSNPRLHMAWRTDSYGSQEAMLADVVANVLTNKGEAGLLDLHINQNQKALWAQAYSVGFKQYGYFSMVIIPKENQSWEEAQQLLFEEINKIKNGDFSEDLLHAVKHDFKLQRLKSWETADGLATTLYDSYIKGRSWSDELNEMPQYEQLTKQDVVDFANDFFQENYVEVFKEKGINDKLIRVENPGITPVKINREQQSDFFKSIVEIPTEKISPHFINYQEAIESAEIKGKKYFFVENKYNSLAQLHFIFPMGTDHDKELSISCQYLQYLGTTKYSPEQLRQEFYKIGVTNDFRYNHNELVIVLSGLEENLHQGALLLQHWLDDAVADTEVYQDFVQSVLESREFAKKNKDQIMSALVNYAKFGKNSRKRDVLSQEELLALDVDKLTDKMSNLFYYPYEIFFYGKGNIQMQQQIATYIKPEKLSVPEPRKYAEQETSGKVYFANYDMVQMEMCRVAKSQKLNSGDFGKINVFNEYFGRGLSSIVFQEMRESKSLAYSAYVSYLSATELGNSDFVSTYIGTQPDKLNIAVETLQELMSHLPQIPLQFEQAKNSVLRQIESGRIVRAQVYLNFKKLNRLGIFHDFREEMYHEIEQLSLEDLTQFYNLNVKSLNYNTALLGKKENLDRQSIAHLGEFTELTLEEIFGF